MQIARSNFHWQPIKRPWLMIEKKNRNICKKNLSLSFIFSYNLISYTINEVPENLFFSDNRLNYNLFIKCTHDKTLQYGLSTVNYNNCDNNNNNINARRSLWFKRRIKTPVIFYKENIFLLQFFENQAIIRCVEKNAIHI